MGGTPRCVTCRSSRSQGLDLVARIDRPTDLPDQQITRQLPPTHGRKAVRASTTKFNSLCTRTAKNHSGNQHSKNNWGHCHCRSCSHPDSRRTLCSIHQGSADEVEGAVRGTLKCVTCSSRGSETFTRSRRKLERAAWARDAHILRPGTGRVQIRHACAARSCPDRMSAPADKQEVTKNLFDTAADIRKTAALLP